jgi:hypothetical protein
MQYWKLKRKILTSVKERTNLDKIKHQDIRNKLQNSSILEKCYMKRWVGHMDRIQDTKIRKQGIQYKPKGKTDLEKNGHYEA